jgi:single-strand DNA-binding protein
MEASAMSLNRVTIIGNLGQDPEVRQLPKSKQLVASFSVATDESFTGQGGNRQEKAELHRVVVYGRLAENCGSYLKKGRQVHVEGHLQTRDYEDRNGGARRYRTRSSPSACSSSAPSPRGRAARPSGQPKMTSRSEWLSATEYCGEAPKPYFPAN